MQTNGAGFAGFAAWLDMSPADSDMFAIPDPNSLIQLPWNKEVGWLASDLWMDGKPVDASPRIMLKKQIKSLQNEGLIMKSGVECEYFLISSDGSTIADTKDTQSKPCYDQSSLMRRYELIKEICDCMIEMGWNPYQNDHEDANGQFEMNWDYTECLTTADRHVFFKFMVKSIAEKHGLRATFMPKPFSQLTGNGCHAHVSVWDKKKKKNLFHDTSDQLGLSKMGYQFIGGIMKSVDSFAAWLNPCLNSYERLNAKTTNSGSTYSPTAVTYSGNNRTHMIRIPDEGRFEFRAADGAVNPYLLQSGIIAMGLDGMKNKRSPGKQLDINMYTQGHKLKRVKKLPNSLEQAIKKFSNDTIVKKSIGAKVVSKYVKLKKRELKEFSQVGEANKASWMRKNIIDC